MVTPREKMAAALLGFAADRPRPSGTNSRPSGTGPRPPETDSGGAPPIDAADTRRNSGSMPIGPGTPAGLPAARGDAGAMGGMAAAHSENHSGDHPSPRPDAIRWLTSQTRRDLLRRRTVAGGYCSIGGLILAAAVSTWIAFDFANAIVGLQGDLGWEDDGGFRSVFFVPKILIGLSSGVAVASVGLAAWGRIPGLRGAVTAVDWESAADTVACSLRIGKTYPESLRLAAEIVPAGSVRNWLFSASRRIDRGEPVESAFGGRVRGEASQADKPRGDQGSGPPAAVAASGDLAVVQAITANASDRPDVQWQAVTEYFRDVARHRCSLVKVYLPTCCLLISGLLVWLAVSATLGWMWRAVAHMLEVFS